MPVVLHKVAAKEKFTEVHRPMNKALFSKTEMSEGDKKALRRKVKKIKKSKGKSDRLRE